LIGVSVRNYQEGGAFTLLLTLVLTAIGPVVAPPERLPAFMLLLGRFSPATYAADALRQTLLGPVTGGLLLDLTMLAGFTVLLFGLTLRKMDWRQR
jgi:ABC-2 type transport system permease protein